MSKARSTPSKSRSPPASAARPPALQRVPDQAWIGPALLLLSLTVLAYLPAIGGGFIWDDDPYVTMNPTLRSLAGLGQIWFKIGAVPQYYPLVHTGFWLEYHLWGLNALGYHLVNVLLHGTGAVLLWRALTRLELPGALLAAAIFALHPVQVESVAWVTERKNVLAGVFYFAAALSYWRFVEADSNPAASAGRRRFLYLGALALFVAALWSKTVTCSLPAALLLVRWWKQGSLRGRDVWPVLPFFVIGASLGMLTAWMEKHTVGAVGATWDLSFLERCLIAGRALWFYAGKLVWPSPLTFIYPRWDINAGVWWQWLFPAAALAVVTALCLLRHRLGRGPLVAVLFFAGTLFPALGFFNVYPFRYSFVADHFQYLASTGLIACAAAGLTRAVPRWGPRLGVSLDWLRRGLWLLPLGLAVLTWRQTHVYSDLETLWRDTLAKNPAAAIAHNNLGTLLSARGDSAEAEQHYREALRIEPDDPETLSNLGLVLAEQGQVEQAFGLLRRAVALDPNDAEVQCNLGRIQARQGQTAEAIKSFQAAIQLRPRQPEFHYNLGTVLAGLGRTEEAIEQFQQALALRPDYVDAHNNLGLALASLSRFEEAIRHYQEALRVAPHYAALHNNLGNALMRLGRLDEAMRCLQEALQLDPADANAHFNMGNALALKKEYAKAVAEFDETLHLAPGFVQAHRNAALALARLGRREEAVAHLTEALRIQPDYEEAKQQLRALAGPAPE